MDESSEASTMGGHGHSHGRDGHDLEQPLIEENGNGHGHSHGHSEGHGHGHGHANEAVTDTESHLDNETRLKKAVCFALLFMAVEIVGGLIANSLAIITDAAHMLSDVGGFIVSLVALQLAQMEATAEYTFGFKQAEVLGALLSVAIVWALTAVLLWEAVPRFIEPRPIDGKIMFFISLFGFGVNLVLMKVLGHGHSHGGDDHGHSHDGDNVAVQAALAHVIGDIVQSLGVCLAALCIWLQPFDVGFVSTSRGEVSKWNYADPMCTCLFGVIVLNTTKATMVRTTETLMGKAPARIDQTKLQNDIQKIPNVVSIHDLHIWTFGSSDVLCTAHIVVDKHEHQVGALRKAIDSARFAGIAHSTFQMEVLGEMLPTNCGGCDDISPKILAGHHKDGHSHDGDGHSHGDAGHGGHGGGHVGHGGHGGHEGHEGHGEDGHSHGQSGHGHSDHGHSDHGHSHDQGHGHAH
ncbi:unnamed protein product [Effrenium voratum]|nr:unnamed protein product [Effrenium voratum]